MPGVEWVAADLLDGSAVSMLMSEVRPSHLLHFAWYAKPGAFWTAPENFAWVQASLHLLRQFSACGGARVVSAGTCAEYDWDVGLCVENKTPIAPGTAYGVCKASLGAMQAAFCELAGVSSAWGRVFLLYGPREHPERLVPSVVRSLLRGRPARCSHGKQVRDIMHVSDVADAFVALLDSRVEGPVNVASGVPVPVSDVIFGIAERLGRDELVELGTVALLPNDPPLLVADTRRLAIEVGWVPRFDLGAGLDDAIRWWRGEGV